MKTQKVLEKNLHALRAQLDDPLTPDFLAKSIKESAIPKIEAEIAALQNTKTNAAPKNLEKKMVHKKTNAAPKTEMPKLKKLSWKYGIAYADLFPHGKVFQLETNQVCAEQLGIVLNQAEEVFFYGDVDIIAKQGDLVVMVKADDKYRVFNIVGNPADKCVKMSQLFQDGTSTTTTPYFGTKNKPAPADMPPIDSNGERRIDEEATAILDNYLTAAVSTKDMHTRTGKYTAERQLLHRQIVEHFLRNAACIRREQPIAVFMGGMPGSGKSTFIKKRLAWLANESIFKIDADEVRAMLPEYEGWNAAITHDETNDIMKGYDGFDGLFNKIGNKGCSYDLLFDGTMTSSKKHKQLAKDLRAAGYKIYTIYLQINPSVSRTRALARYKKSGRYVPMFVLDEAANAGMAAFEEVKELVDGWILVDGESANITAKGGEPIPSDRDYHTITQPNTAQDPTESNKVDEVPATNAVATSSEQTKVTKAKQHPEHFATESSTFKAVADVLAIFAMTAQIGVADKVVAKVLRRVSDDRIILEVRDAVHRSGIFKAKPQSEKHYFLVEEKSKYLKPIAEPKTAVIIIDSKKEALEEGETATGNILDLLYGNPKDLATCFELQSAVHTCKSGGKCSAEEKKKLQQAAHDCSTKYKKGLGKYVVFVAERTQLFQTALRGLKKVETVKLANAMAEAGQPDTPQPDAPYPIAMDSSAKRALYDAIQDENLVLKVDNAVLTTRKAHWLENQMNQKSVYKAIRPFFYNDNETVKIFEIVKQQYGN